MHTDIKWSYKNWKEATSTLPSGQYPSLYKAWLHIPEESKEDYSSITSTEFFQLIQNLIQAATTMSYA
eukprot:10825636-Ditylum_brightwellii.AAC.1